MPPTETKSSTGWAAAAFAIAAAIATWVFAAGATKQDVAALIKCSEEETKRNANQESRLVKLETTMEFVVKQMGDIGGDVKDIKKMLQQGQGKP